MGGLAGLLIAFTLVIGSYVQTTTQQNYQSFAPWEDSVVIEIELCTSDRLYIMTWVSEALYPQNPLLSCTVYKLCSRLTIATES